MKSVFLQAAFFIFREVLLNPYFSVELSSLSLSRDLRHLEKFNDVNEDSSTEKVGIQQHFPKYKNAACRKTALRMYIMKVRNTI